MNRNGTTPFTRNGTEWKHCFMSPTVALCTITFRTRDNLHKARERLQSLLIFVIGISGKVAHSTHPKELTYCSIEMYGKGASGEAKMYPRYNTHAFHAYFHLK